MTNLIAKAKAFNGEHHWIEKYVQRANKIKKFVEEQPEGTTFDRALSKPYALQVGGHTVSFDIDVCINMNGIAHASYIHYGDEPGVKPDQAKLYTFLRLLQTTLDAHNVSHRGHWLRAKTGRGYSLANVEPLTEEIWQAELATVIAYLNSSEAQ